MSKYINIVQYNLSDKCYEEKKKKNQDEGTKTVRVIL